ncbi:hypothetical protein Krac_2971 [Ktedonobacter racemifer DSM 44963]|uniref:Uncharacterized protein n=1 Tax=Ktedonobacter racemifer DSM 44963 TaxID=485913 RepID=D6U044_KTERA|nr:hypothetical protein Krac_2971 [Ktedonobacter racemifer DSM 44963]
MEQIMEALERGWSPNDYKSSFYNWHLIHEDEWRRIARGYLSNLCKAEACTAAPGGARTFW